MRKKRFPISSLASGFPKQPIAPSAHDDVVNNFPDVTPGGFIKMFKDMYQGVLDARTNPESKKRRALGEGGRTIEGRPVSSKVNCVSCA